MFSISLKKIHMIGKNVKKQAKTTTIELLRGEESHSTLCSAEDVSYSELNLGCRSVDLFLQKNLTATSGLLKKFSGGSSNSEALTSRNDTVTPISHPTHILIRGQEFICSADRLLFFHSTL